MHQKQGMVKIILSITSGLIHAPEGDGFTADPSHSEYNLEI